MPRTALLLHGFAGTGRLWDPVTARLDPARYRPVAPDLRGHGANRSRPITPEAVVQDAGALLGEGAAVVCGYSMGARVALHLALAHPGRVARLVLVAATAGIEDAAERAARRRADEALAARLERGPIERFADRWTTSRIFADDPAPARARQREDVLRNDPPALAAALRGLGPAAWPPVWHRLGELAMPVVAVAGARDARYVALAERLAAEAPDGRLVVVPGAGHGVPREAPEELAAVIAGK